MADPHIPDPSWRAKFANAFRGLAAGVKRQSSFLVHGAATLLVVAAGIVLRVELWQWCLLVLCIFLVLSAEMFNSTLEELAKAIDRNHNPHLGRALDMASAAVLLAVIGAVIVGLLVFGSSIASLLQSVTEIAP